MFTGPRPAADLSAYVTERDRERLAAIRGRVIKALPPRIAEEARRELEAMVPFGELGKARAKQKAKAAKAEPKERPFGYIRAGSVADRICRSVPTDPDAAMTVHQIAALIGADYHHVSTAIATLTKARHVRRRLVPRDNRGAGGRNHCYAYWRAT
jgi:hypothetical protein